MVLEILESVSEQVIFRISVTCVSVVNRLHHYCYLLVFD